MRVRLEDRGVADGLGRGRGHHLCRICGARVRRIGATAYAPWRRTREACETGHALPRARSAGVSPRPRRLEKGGWTRRVLEIEAGHAHCAVGDLEQVLRPSAVLNWHQNRREPTLAGLYGSRGF